MSGGVERLEALRLEAAGRGREGWSYRLRVDADQEGVLRVAVVLKHGDITALASFERGGAGAATVRYWTNSPDMHGERGAEVPAGRVADVLDLAGLLRRLAEEGLPSAALFVAHRALEELVDSAVEELVRHPLEELGAAGDPGRLPAPLDAR